MVKPSVRKATGGLPHLRLRSRNLQKCAYTFVVSFNPLNILRPLFSARYDNKVTCIMRDVVRFSLSG